MPKLLQQVRDSIRTRHYSIRTETAYLHWIKRYIIFHNERHPCELGEPEVSRFLSHLAVDRKVAASTQNQALSALLFLYRKVLNQPLNWLDNLKRAKKPARLAFRAFPIFTRSLLLPTGAFRLKFNDSKASFTLALVVYGHVREQIEAQSYESAAYDWPPRSQPLPQVFVEKFESARPGQFGGGFVISRRRVVVKAVLCALVHVQRIDLLVGL